MEVFVAISIDLEEKPAEALTIEGIYRDRQSAAVGLLASSGLEVHEIEMEVGQSYDQTVRDLVDGISVEAGSIVLMVDGREVE